MQQNNIKLTNHDNEIGTVSLPFGQNQFKDFIVSLLGKPQNITKNFRGTFEIDKNNIVTLHNLLDQRINQQNDANLIQFRATIYYSDNSTVTLNDFDHLVDYNETLPISSKAIHLTWQYLIKFRDKNSYEKQEINLSFITIMENAIQIDQDFIYPHSNQVSLRINHTARTWGADIEGLLSKHIETLVKKDSKIFESIKYNSDGVKNFTLASIALVTLLFSAYNTYKLNSIDNLNEVFWINHYGKLMFLFIGIYIISKITLVFLDEFEFFNKPGFILLTQQSYKDRQKDLKKYRYRVFRYLFTILISIAVSILANYIYSYLTS